MAAGVIGQLWTIEDPYDAVMGQGPNRSRAVRKGGFFIRGGIMAKMKLDYAREKKKIHPLAWIAVAAGAIALLISVEIPAKHGTRVVPVTTQPTPGVPGISN